MIMCAMCGDNVNATYADICASCYDHERDARIERNMKMNEKDQETYEMLVELLNGQKAFLLDVQKEIECDERELKDQEEVVNNMKKMIAELKHTRIKTKLMIEVLSTAISGK